MVAPPFPARQRPLAEDDREGACGCVGCQVRSGEMTHAQGDVELAAAGFGDMTVCLGCFVPLLRYAVTLAGGGRGLRCPDCLTWGEDMDLLVRPTGSAQALKSCAHAHRQ